jgi:hypothetical protein
MIGSDYSNISIRSSGIIHCIWTVQHRESGELLVIYGVTEQK